jgi:hypothetical protein
MWFRQWPQVCDKCAALGRGTTAPDADRSRVEHMTGFGPHDDREQLAEAGHIEWGIWLYRCRRCSSYWEFDAWTYFPERSKLRRVSAVASLEKWTRKQRRAMKPRSMLVAGALVFGGGVLCIAAFAGIWWLAEILFSRTVAESICFFVVMVYLLLLYRSAQLQEAVQVRPQGPKRAELGAAPPA